LTTDQAIFTKSYFKMSESLIDFSKPFDVDAFKSKQKEVYRLWGPEPRYSKFSIDVGHFESAMNSRNYDNFNQLMQFFSETFAKKPTREETLNENYRQKNIESTNRALMSEFKELGIQGLQKHIENQVRIVENEFILYHSNANIFDIFVRKVTLRLLKDNDHHFELSIQRFRQTKTYETNGRNDMTLSMEKLKMTNLRCEDPASSELIRKLSESTFLIKR
jgi:hypothetical protein